MGIYINIIGQTSNKNNLMANINDFIKSNINENLLKLANIQNIETELFFGIHPAEEPMRIILSDYKNGDILVKGKTNSAGPGYHAYIIELIDKIGKEFDITWTGNNDEGSDGDPTGYYKNRDFSDLQNQFLLWLNALSDNLLKEKKDDLGMIISLPVHFPTPKRNFFTMTPLGYFDKDWFKKVVKFESSEQDNIGKTYYPWWNKELDGQFWLNLALNLMWTACPWHKPKYDHELGLYHYIISCLEYAYSLDKSLNFPYSNWKELLELLEDKNKLSELEKISSGNYTDEKIGYRREELWFYLQTKWRILLPGNYAENHENNGETLSYRYKNRNVRLTYNPLDTNDSKSSNLDFLINSYFKEEQRESFTEIYSDDLEKMKRVAGLKFIENEKNGYWYLYGVNAIKGEVLVTGICFTDENDKEWAINTWKSIEYFGDKIVTIE